MSTIRFATIDGRRVELTDDQLTWETRCDACGEFVAAADRLDVDYRLLIGGVPGAQEFVNLHGRPECVTRLDWPGIIQAHLLRMLSHVSADRPV